MTTSTNSPVSASAAISARIVSQVAAGKTVREAVDAVLGAGAYAKIASDLYDALRAQADVNRSPRATRAEIAVEHIRRYFVDGLDWREIDSGADAVMYVTGILEREGFGPCAEDTMPCEDDPSTLSQQPGLVCWEDSLISAAPSSTVAHGSVH